MHTPLFSISLWRQSVEGFAGFLEVFFAEGSSTFEVIGDYVVDQDVVHLDNSCEI